MIALTICQPYAHLIANGEKRVENRTWPIRHRGNVVIHAGKSRSWLELDDAKTNDELYEIPLSDMAFGAIVAVANLSDCITSEQATGANCPPHLLWMRDHHHTNGPWCFVLSNIRKLKTPIPWRGAQGPFEIPDEVIANAEMDLVVAV